MWQDFLPNGLNEQRVRKSDEFNYIKATRVMMEKEGYHLLEPVGFITFSACALSTRSISVRLYYGWNDDITDP